MALYSGATRYHSGQVAQTEERVPNSHEVVGSKPAPAHAVAVQTEKTWSTPFFSHICPPNLPLRGNSVPNGTPTRRSALALPLRSGRFVMSRDGAGQGSSTASGALCCSVGGYSPTMGLLLILGVIAVLVFFGIGFAIHVLWIVAIVLLVAWLIGLAFGRGRAKT